MAHHTSTLSPPAAAPRAFTPYVAADRSMAEFTAKAIFLGVLFGLIFGIISYSYMMSFRQAMTQATAEASRAGAIAVSGQSQTRALSALNDALDPYGITCNGTQLLDGVTAVGTCSIPAPSGCTSPSDPEQCLTVSVSYNYRDHPLLPTFPGLGISLPDTIGFTSTAQVN